MSTITNEQKQSIADFLATHELPRGLGNEESACSIAAINLSLNGKLTDDIPECMSEVIGKWIIVVQDSMPDEMRNSAEWKALLPHAAGTGRKLENERLTIVLDWMWQTTLPSLQQLADKYGFGGSWGEMCELKTSDAADAAAYAAYAAYAADAARAADAAADAARAAARATRATRAAYAADAATRAAYAADAATRAAYAADAAYAAWQTFNPCEVLRKLIEAE